MTDWITHLQHGYRALSENRPTIAFTHFHAAYEDNPDHPLVCWAWGQALAQTGHSKEAVMLLEKAARAEPELVEINISWAKAVMDLGDFSSAERILEELQVRHSSDPLILLTLVELHVRRGDPETAARFCGQAREQGAEPRTLAVASAQIEQVRGLLMSREKNFSAAKTHFKNAIELDPAWAGPRVNLGVIAEQSNEPAEALSWYAGALELEPEHPVALYNCARLHARMGELKQARELVSRLTTLHPEYPGGRELADSVRRTV